MPQDRPLSGVESDFSTDSAQTAHTASVTDLLVDWCSGDAEALNRLMPLVYNELRRLARYHLRGRGPDQTLQPTALVHEAYLRLANQADPVVKSRVHFYAIVSHMMRCVLVDHARRHHAAKRGGNLVRVSTDRVALVPAKQDLNVL